jgi:hypothetical protein
VPGTNRPTRELSSVGLRPENQLVILYGDSSDQRVKAAMEILDKSGLSYQHESRPDTRRRCAPYPGLTCGASSLTGLSHNEVIDFLREHGAKFEDS